MDETTAFDVLKDKVASLIDYHDDLEAISDEVLSAIESTSELSDYVDGMDDKAFNLLNHGNIDGNDNADQRTLDHVLTEQLKDDQEDQGCENEDCEDCPSWEYGRHNGYCEACGLGAEEPDIKKNCVNCEFRGSPITEEPCDTCWDATKFVAKKETLAADSLETCFTCEFAALNVHKEPCFTCFKHSAWIKYA